jgi:putative phage-type endonuclease
MTVTYMDHEQGSAEWHQARAGLLTASNFKTAVSKGTGRADLLDTLAFQRRTGVVEETYKSAAMQRGNDLEPEARDYVALMLGAEIAEVGLATNSELPGLGASLDGLIMPHSDRCVGVEIKNPLGKTHNRYCRQGKLPALYREQVHGQMLVCELDYSWFCSYHPDDSEQLLIRVDRDEHAISELKAGLDKFLEDLDKMPK